MKKPSDVLIIGTSFILGCVLLAIILGQSLISIKKLERTVTVKGLAEREVPADIAIWTLAFTRTSQSISQIYNNIAKDITTITNFMTKNTISPSEITIAPTDITDRIAQDYSTIANLDFRFAATQIITIYSTNIDLIRMLSSRLPELGQQGISFTGNSRYETPIQYIFTNLNQIKPSMIQEATQQAKEVALKFAEDSQSKVGKIKTASQGQFTINDRDTNNPHIKKIRIVSTIEYYLSD